MASCSLGEVRIDQGEEMKVLQATGSMTELKGFDIFLSSCHPTKRVLKKHPRKKDHVSADELQATTTFSQACSISLCLAIGP